MPRARRPTANLAPAPPPETFADVLHAVIRAQRWSYTTLAARLGVSTKSITRYTCGSLPHVARRHGLVHRLRDLEPSLVARVARSLDVDDDFVRGIQPAVAKVDRAAARGALEAAVMEAANGVNTGPDRTRATLATFLDRLANLGLDRDSARALLAAPAAVP